MDRCSLILPAVTPATSRVSSQSLESTETVQINFSDSALANASDARVVRAPLPLIFQPVGLSQITFFLSLPRFRNDSNCPSAVAGLRNERKPRGCALGSVNYNISKEIDWPERKTNVDFSWRTRSERKTTSDGRGERSIDPTGCKSISTILRERGLVVPPLQISKNMFFAAYAQQGKITCRPASVRTKTWPCASEVTIFPMSPVRRGPLAASACFAWLDDRITADPGAQSDASAGAAEGPADAAPPENNACPPPAEKCPPAGEDSTPLGFKAPARSTLTTSKPPAPVL